MKKKTVPGSRVQPNMKALPDGSNPYAGTMDCMAKTVQGEGFRALYKGLSAMFARQTSTVHWVPITIR